MDIQRRIETFDQQTQFIRNHPGRAVGFDDTEEIPEDQLPIKLEPISVGKKVVRVGDKQNTKDEFVYPVRTPRGVVVMDSKPTWEQLSQIIPESLREDLMRG